MKYCKDCKNCRALELFGDLCSVDYESLINGVAEKKGLFSSKRM